MKITEIRFGMLRVPLKTPFKTALRTVDTIEDVVISVHTDTGHVGYGEAPATAVITGDTHGSIIEAIHKIIAPRLIGQEISNLNRITRDPGDEGEEGERLVQDAVERVDARQVGVGGRVGADHVVGGDEEIITEVLDRLRVGAQTAHIGTEIVLGQDRADLHDALLLLAPRTRCRHAGGTIAGAGWPAGAGTTKARTRRQARALKTPGGRA